MALPKARTESKRSKHAANQNQNQNLQDWIACDFCNSWVVPEPSDSEDVITFVTKFSHQKFCCKQCKQINKLSHEINSLSEELTRIKDFVSLETTAKVNQHSEIMNSIESNVKKTWAEVASTNSNSLRPQANPQSNTLSASQIRYAADEMQDIERRKLNLIITGLPEKGSDVLDLIKYANIECALDKPIQEDNIKKAERVGISRSDLNERPRLLRIQLYNSAIRRALLTMRRASNLELPGIAEDKAPTSSPDDEASASFNTKTIFIRPDLTKLQLVADRELRFELLKKGKDNFKIQRGKIVPRQSIEYSNAINDNHKIKNPENNSPDIPSTAAQKKPLQCSPFGQAADDFAKKKIYLK